MTIRAKAPTNDQRARDTLMWARKNRIAVSELAIGDVHLVVTDLGIVSSSGKRSKTDEEAKASIYARYGGQPFADATKTDEATSTYEDEDE